MTNSWRPQDGVAVVAAAAHPYALSGCGPGGAGGRGSSGAGRGLLFHQHPNPWRLAPGAGLRLVEGLASNSVVPEGNLRRFIF